MMPRRSSTGYGRTATVPGTRLSGPSMTAATHSPVSPRKVQPWYGHEIARLRRLALTPPSPAIPFVTAATTDPEVKAALIMALARVIQAPEWAEARAGLLLRDIVVPEQVDYRIQLTYADEAAALGYPVLR